VNKSPSVIRLKNSTKWLFHCSVYSPAPRQTLAKNLMRTKENGVRSDTLISEMFTIKSMQNLALSPSDCHSFSRNSVPGETYSWSHMRQRITAVDVNCQRCASFRGEIGSSQHWQIKGEQKQIRRCRRGAIDGENKALNETGISKGVGKKHASGGRKSFPQNWVLKRKHLLIILMKLAQEEREGQQDGR